MRVVNMRIAAFLCLAAVGGTAAFAWAGASVLDADVGSVPRGMKLVLLAGQSNMAGRAPATGETRRPIERCWMLGRDGRWKKAANPIHFDKPSAGVGPADEFARRYLADHPGETLGLVPCAVGGSPLSSWLPEPEGRDGANFRKAVKRIRIAKADGKFVAILWHQGETDAARRSGSELAASYPRDFSRIAAAFRRETGDVPVIVGEIGRWMRRDGDHAARVNPAIRECARVVHRCACVSSQGLSNKDAHHFDAPSVKTLGARYYEAWKGMAPAASAPAQSGGAGR